MKFSVLLSVYHKEKASNLRECFDSLLGQSLLPDEIVSPDMYNLDLVLVTGEQLTWAIKFKVKADFIAESGMDAEGAAAFNDLMMSVLNDLAIGKVSKETLQLFKRASDYEKDVEGAREQGRVDGRNEKIEVEKKRMKGSGLPNAQASGNASEEVDAKPSNETASWLGKFPRR